MFKTNTMKVSKFNSILPYFGNYIMYNSFSDHFILVQPLLKDLLNAAVAEKDVAGLENYHPTFFKELLNKGFIVEETVDEIEKVKKISREVDGNLSTYLLTINPTMGCNFKCWYCYETHIPGSKMGTPIIDRVLRFIDNEKGHNKNLSFFNMSFFGGEPLIYYDQVVVPLLKGAKNIFDDTDITFSSTFTTNGYLIDQNKIDFLKEHSVTGMQITLDGSREFHDKVRYVTESKGSYDKIIENIKLLAKNDLEVTMRINFTRENFESCISISDDFADLEEEFKGKIMVDFHQVWQDSPVGAVSLAPALDKFLESGFPVRSAATILNNVVDSCYADKNNSATINYNGEVFKCTARDFTTANSMGVLGDDGKILWKPEYELRQNAKFKNAPCLECRMLPICNGGCSQHAYDNLGSPNGYCVFQFDEHRKDELILERFRLRTL